jgi:hypothetical protein
MNIIQSRLNREDYAGSVLMCISELTFAIGVINLWNRLNISFQTVPGSADEMLGLTKAGSK